MTDQASQVIERFTYTPYGQLTVDRVTSWGNRDDDDSDDKGTPGSTCSTMSGACRVVDLDFDGGERSEREWPATRKADMDVRERVATRPQEGSRKRTIGGYAADGTLFDSLPAGLGQARTGRSDRL